MDVFDYDFHPQPTQDPDDFMSDDLIAKQLQMEEDMEVCLKSFSMQID